MEKTDSDILQEVIGEWRTLSRILAIQKHDPTTSYIIGARLYHITKAIDKIFVNHGPMTSTLRTAMHSILHSRDEFLHDISASFSRNHKRFMAFLKDTGMNEREKNYCVMGAIGFYGKDIGMYMSRKNHYNICSAIRKKLGLSEHDTNLDNHLRSLLQ